MPISYASFRTETKDEMPEVTARSVPQTDTPELIAVVGMGCRLPGGISNPAELWDALRTKTTGYRDFNQDRLNLDGFYHPNYQRLGSIHTRGACLLDEDPRLFDHAFFSMTPGEVLTMDPLQRKVLEVAYEAFENAGEPWHIFSGSCTGVFIGNFNSDHSTMQMYDVDFPMPYSSTGGGASSISNRVNHLLNLRGPSMTIDTACSSSMYAVHFAVNAIRNGDCESAIVGGSNLITAPEMQLLTVKLGALSPTSTCHTFDSSADGYGRGEGVCALYLKKYSEAVAGGYPIRGIIRGTAVNANGRTAGISHPSIEGQETLIRQAYRNAALSTKFTGYFECHGTGTPVGDPVEVAAIQRVFGCDPKDHPLLIGSVKTNLGHAEPASGIIGIMKAILSLEKGIIPATVGVKTLNPNIDFDAAGVKVVTETTPWPAHAPRRISVNSFGYGGANGHCIIDHRNLLLLKEFDDLSTDNTCVSVSTTSSEDTDAILPQSPHFSDRQGIGSKPRTSTRDAATVPAPKASKNLPSSANMETRRLVLLVFSAHDHSSLASNILAIRDICPNYSLSDLAYTLSTRRTRFLYKTFLIVESSVPTKGFEINKLIITKSLSTKPSHVAFVFTGQGAQWQNMGAELMKYGVFESSIRAQDSVLSRLSFPPPWTLKNIFSGQSNVSVHEPEVSQTLCTSLQIAIVDLLQSWNVTAEATVGHSSGEIAAAYAAGCLSLPEAITTAYCRGKAIASNSRKGLMLAVGLNVEKLRPFLTEVESGVNIAAFNSQDSVTLSGNPEGINWLHETLQNRDIFSRLLETGENAYHSHHMSPIGESYESLLEEALAEIAEPGELKKYKRYPLRRWVSSVSPLQEMNGGTGTPTYWRQNLESPVQFLQGMESLMSTKNVNVDILIEIGPHSALQTPLKQIITQTGGNNGVEPPTYLPTLKKREDGMANILSLCGSLFTLNYPVDLSVVNSVEQMGNGALCYTHGSVCTDLPTYKYNYGPPIYYEPRISREMKRRKHLRHDLLGVLQAGCAKERPAWRNILKVRDVPWLKDHQLIPNSVLPASGYVCLAIEAATQFTNGRGKDSKEDFCLKLRNVWIKSAMILPDDDFGLEIMVNMQACSPSTPWFEFKISSVAHNTDIWTEHASGLISRVPHSSRALAALDKDIDPRVIDVGDWYTKFNDIGLGYGKAFQGLSDLRSDPKRYISTAKIALSTTRDMFKGPESPYRIHPASLDICHQLALVACHGGQTGRVKNAFIPVFIDNMTVWPRTGFDHWGRGVAVGHLKGLRGAHASVQLFTLSGDPLMEIGDLRCVTHHGGKSLDHDGEQFSPYARLMWKPDISTLSQSQAQQLFPPPVASKAVQHILDTMEEISSYMVVELAEKYATGPYKDESLRRFMKRVCRWAGKDLPYGDAARQISSQDRLDTIGKLCQPLEKVVDIRHTKRIFDNFPQMVNGTTTGVEVALQDGTLAEMYTYGIGIAAAYPQLERLLDLLGHQNPSMRVLEIGAGTGAATRVAVHTLRADTNSKRYSSYTFTDKSTAFLHAAKLEFSHCTGISYQTLDINQSPFEQGFVQEFDLIIASQCLHAAKDVLSTLKNLRDLINKGGRMIILETTRPLLAHGLAYGTFPDYWGDQDDQESPFLGLETWRLKFQASGFSGIDLELGDYEGNLKIVSTILTTAVEAIHDILPHSVPRPVTGGEIYIIYYSRPGSFHYGLEAELLERGVLPILTSLDECQLPSNCRVFFTVDLEFNVLADGEEEEFEKIKDMVRQASSILWITQGGMLEGYDPKSAICTGLIRMLTTENPLSRYGIFHLEPSNVASSSSITQQIADREIRLHNGDTENEFAVCNDIVHISRLIPDPDLNIRYRRQNHPLSRMEKKRLQGEIPMVADFESPGLLSSLYFKQDEAPHTPLADDWVEVRTSAIGLNWKDIAVSAGRLDMQHFSSECSGVVTKCGRNVQNLRTGDRVYALAWGKFGNFVRFPASFAQLMEPNYSFSEMASIPIVLCTAVYALRHLARLQKGERVLIQSATGGLGLAAVQIANDIGAEIFATVGTEEKRRYLCDLYRIPEDRIISSRDVGEVEKLMSATENTGFNVILSSANGNIMHETWRCLAPRGRFIDVGRVDVQNHSTMAMEIFQRNATFSSFDLSIMATQDPEFCGSLMKEVDSLLRDGKIHPITPIRTFDVSELEQALLYFSKGQHVGKIVITYENATSVVKMLPPIPQASFDPNAQYILAGGLGGLGRSILQWMVDRGAKNLTVLSRSTTRNPEASLMIDELAGRNISVEVTSCNVTVKEDVENAIRIAGRDRPIKGILHAAAVLLDRLFDNLPHAQWKSGLAAKVQGTINLHQASLEHELPLDFFVMASSFEAVVAMPTQAAYCAANSFQDAFARYRKARGLPACSIAFGLITEIGEFGQRAITRNMIQRHGLYPTGELDFLRLLEAAFLDPTERNFSGHACDPLTKSQITTCLDPYKLAGMSQAGDRNSPEAPRWYADKKFSHLLQAIEDHLGPVEQPQGMKAAKSTVTINVDVAIDAGNIEEASRIVTCAIMERTAALLVIAPESVEAENSVAHYGVDSLIAVELRSWLVLLFESSIPLLKLLDERTSMREVGAWITAERQKRKSHGLE